MDVLRSIVDARLPPLFSCERAFRGVLSKGAASLVFICAFLCSATVFFLASCGSVFIPRYFFGNQRPGGGVLSSWNIHTTSFFSWKNSEYSLRDPPAIGTSLHYSFLVCAGVMSALLVLASHIDNILYLLPDTLTFGIALCALVYSAGAGGVVLKIGVAFLICVIGYMLSSRGIIGYGDVKLCAAVALSCGIAIFSIILCALIGSGTWGMWKIFGGKGRIHIPLGPWICSATWSHFLLFAIYMGQYNHV